MSWRCRALPGPQRALLEAMVRDEHYQAELAENGDALPRSGKKARFK